MEAKELRIGNWIQSSSNKEYQINLSWYECCKNSTEGRDIQLDTLPIPLTEEWLIEFGFEYRTDTGFDGWYSNPILGESIRIFEVENKWYKYSSAHIVIKYVHQLQNFYFALTGEELNKQD